MNERIKELMNQTGVPVSMPFDKWCEKFAELIINECAACCGSQADMRNIRKRFGLPVESNIKYPGPEAQGHHSQYGREYNIPK